MYDQILVPTDGSEAAEAAFAHAFDLASRYDATVHALYVVDTAMYSSLDARTDLVIDALSEQGEHAVDAVRDRGETAGVPVVEDVVRGSPAKAILGYVEQEGIDLVVMGTHGRRGLDRLVLGSVTERVLRSSPAPVMVVQGTRPGSRDAEDEDEQ
ncbi:universal stress protein [Halobium salinum]|uniref:Universal stress protein n=1 Tax=Halobium salinum TaxID=1364940 RepID=A0ABD5PG15_9EURY|nr:universal stress protein [Halobium salinum]